MSFNSCHWLNHSPHDYFPENPAHKRTPSREPWTCATKGAQHSPGRSWATTGFQCYPSYCRNSKISVYTTYPSLQLSNNSHSQGNEGLYLHCFNFSYFIFIKFYLKWIRVRIKPYQQWARGFRNRLLMFCTRHCPLKQQYLHFPPW